MVSVPVGTNNGVTLNAAENGSEVGGVATRASGGRGAIGVDDDEGGSVDGCDDSLDLEVGVVRER